MQLALTAVLLGFGSLLASCTGAPRGVIPVNGFDSQRYLGTWHEIARLDHSFERGLSHVTAEYTLRDDGRIDVLNKGYNSEEKKWNEAAGVAKFQGEETVGSLSVTFRWPFAGGYHIIALDHDEYQWAMICGPSRKYLWILAREKQLDKAIFDTLVQQARDLEFPVDELIIVDQLSPIE